MTVSGLTITKADRQSLQIPHSQAHRMRSAAVSFGRFLNERWRSIGDIYPTTGCRFFQSLRRANSMKAVTALGV